MKKILLTILVLCSFLFAEMDWKIYSEELVTCSTTAVTETVDGYATYYSFKPLTGNINISLSGTTTPNTMDRITEGSLYSPDFEFKVGDTITYASTTGTAYLYILRYWR